MNWIPGDLDRRGTKKPYFSRRKETIGLQYASLAESQGRRIGARMVNKAIVVALALFTVSMGLTHAAYADGDDNGGATFSFGFAAPPAYYPPPPPVYYAPPPPPPTYYAPAQGYYAPPPAYWGGNNRGDDDDQRDDD